MLDLGWAVRVMSLAVVLLGGRYKLYNDNGDKYDGCYNNDGRNDSDCNRNDQIETVSSSSTKEKLTVSSGVVGRAIALV